MRYNWLDMSERLDYILDKISKYGISSITQIEKDFLDSHAKGEEFEVHDRIIKNEIETVFEDDYGYFKFEYKETEDYGDEIHYIGVLYTPDIQITKKEKIKGILEGRIIVYDDGQISPDFYHKLNDEIYYDIFEFCDGLEYELDIFMDYVIQEIKSINKS
jgi:hypothetical protein